MQEKLSGDRENQDANEESQAVSEVTADEVLHEMQQMVRNAAGSPDGWGDNVKKAIGRAASALGLSWREAKGWWYCERREPTVAYYLTVRKRYEAWCEREARMNAARKELLDARIDAARGIKANDADHLSLSGEALPGDRQPAR